MQSIRQACAFLVSAILLTGCGSATTDGGGQNSPKVTVTLAASSIPADGNTSASAIYQEASGDTIAAAFTWTVSDGTVASITSTGQITAIAPGTTAITATANGTSGSATLTVATAAVSRVNMITESIQLQAASSTPLSATPYDSQNRPISGLTLTWASSNTAVATVTQDGVVHGIAAGTATITASVGGKSGATVVTVD